MGLCWILHWHLIILIWIRELLFIESLFWGIASNLNLRLSIWKIGFLVLVSIFATFSIQISFILLSVTFCKWNNLFIWLTWRYLNPTLVCFSHLAARRCVLIARSFIGFPLRVETNPFDALLVISVIFQEVLRFYDRLHLENFLQKFGVTISNLIHSFRSLLYIHWFPVFRLYIWILHLVVWIDSQKLMIFVWEWVFVILLGFLNLTLHL